MTVYAAFLRGINLGSVNKVSMPDLRTALTASGHPEVKTYINSGNVVLSSGRRAATVERELADLIQATFGLDIGVTVRTAPQLQAILAGNPFPDGDPSQVTVAFLAAEPGPAAPDRVRALATDHEPFVFAGREVYVHYARGLGKSRLAERFSATVGVSATVRTIRTVAKVSPLPRSSPAATRPDSKASHRRAVPPGTPHRRRAWSGCRYRRPVRSTGRPGPTSGRPCRT